MNVMEVMLREMSGRICFSKKKKNVNVNVNVFNLINANVNANLTAKM